MLVAALGALALAPRAKALELADGKLSINGFGTWLYGRTLVGPNSYLEADPEGRYDSGEFSLAISAHPTDRATVAARFDLHPDMGGIELDWVFAEWKFSDQVRLHVGRFKHPLGLYGELTEVGTVQPFLSLPQGVYGPMELVVDGVDGAGLSGTAYDRNGWTLSYDTYLGRLQYQVNEPFQKLLAPQSLQPGGVLEQVEEEAREALGGRLALATPVEGLSLRLSAYANASGQRAGADESGLRWVAGASIDYSIDKLTLQAEYFHHHDFDLARTHAAYALASYFLTEHLQVALRGELAQTELLPLPAGSPLLRHRELAAAVNWWFTPTVVVKLSVHAVDGNRFARPELLDDALLTGTLSPTTVVALGGVQFTF